MYPMKSPLMAYDDAVFDEVTGRLKYAAARRPEAEFSLWRSTVQVELLSTQLFPMAADTPPFDAVATQDIQTAKLVTLFSPQPIPPETRVVIHYGGKEPRSGRVVGCVRMVETVIRTRSNPYAVQVCLK